MPLDTNKCEKAIQLLIKARGSSWGNTGSTRGRKNREYLATFPSELHCVRMHSSVANSWKGLPVNFVIQRRRFDIPTGTKWMPI
jgi:hypothetical protein